MGDERLIQQVLARYARAVDRRDADAVAALYTPDGIERLSWHDRGTRTVMATFQGQAEIRYAVSTFLAPHAPHAWAHHMTFDPIVTITGDTATLDAQFVVVEVDGATRTITPAHAGYYELKLRRHDGEWRIVENDTILDLAPARLDASRGVLQVPIGPQRLLAIASRSSTTRGGSSAHIDGDGARRRHPPGARRRHRLDRCVPALGGGYATERARNPSGPLPTWQSDLH